MKQYEQKQSIGEIYAYIKSLPAIARAIYPGASPFKLIKKTASFSFYAIRYRRELQQVLGVFDCAELEQVLALFPAIHEKPFTPYVCVDWALAERAEQLQNHFQFLKLAFGENSAEIYKPGGFKLFDFKTTADDVYSVELFPGYQSEGSIGLRLCDAEQREVYALSFHLSGESEKACFIGALQGPNDRIPDRQKTIVTLTRSLHGLRPKALMVETVYMLAKSLGIDNIYGISCEGHIYQSAHYTGAKRSMVEFDYDRLWGEYCAEVQSDSFFKLPVRPVRKDIASIKSNKRSLYRKRYAWLEQKTEQTTNTIDQLLMTKSNSNKKRDANKAA